VKERLKKAAVIGGRLLGVAGLLYVLYLLFAHYRLADLLQKSKEILPILPLLLLLNIASTLLGIWAWKLMLGRYAKESVSFLEAFWYFSRTEIAKYLPGNIFHYVGRQAFAARLGLSQKEMAMVSALFTLSLAAATLLAATILAAASGLFAGWLLGLLLIATALALGAGIFFYPSFSITQKLAILAILTLSIALQGAMLDLVLARFFPITPSLAAAFASIYVLSWLVGFVTPGASGGLGVREGAFIALADRLGLAIESATAAFGVLFVRIVNILTDTILYLATHFLAARVAQKKA